MSAPDRHFSLYGHPQVLRYGTALSFIPPPKVARSIARRLPSKFT